MPSHIVCYGIRPAQLKREKEDATTKRKTEERGARMKTGVPKPLGKIEKSPNEYGKYK
ncbi:MAG: hypothetical protein K0U54_13590 [Bacteroidetes bacterium]|nr:hypothetical protein [Bacteroidota bacterium]